MAEQGAVAGVDRGGRPRDPGNDVAILDAALDLLVERGAAGASIEAIAKRAGVAKLTVYRRWESKEELLIAALEHAREADVEAPAPADTIEGVISVVAELLGRPRFRALMARVIGASVDHPRLIGAYRARYIEPRLAALAATTRRAVEEGRFPAGTEEGVVQDLLAGAIGFVLLGGEELTAAEIERRLWGLLRGVGYREVG